MTERGMTVTVDLDAKCKRCGRKGATQSGYCLECLTVYIANGNRWPRPKQARTARRP